MHQHKPAWVEHQRKRWTRPNEHLWIRHDAYRFAPPGAPRWVGKDVVRYFWPEHRNDQPNQANNFKDQLGLATEREVVFRLKDELAALKAEISFRRLLRESKAFNPNQPRDDHGRWTNGGSSLSAHPRLYVASNFPRIPQQRPPSSNARTAIAKAVAIWLAEKAVGASEVIAKSSWLYHAIPYINSYLDAPKALEELQQDASTPRAGYDRHHIVEQTSAEEAGYPRRKIDAPDNLVRIPRMKHWEINAWYQTENADYGRISPREYLSGKDWDERRRVGLEALIKFGVLKP